VTISKEVTLVNLRDMSIAELYRRMKNTTFHFKRDQLYFY